MTTPEHRNKNRLKLAFIGGAYDSAVGRVHRVAVEMDQRFELVAGCFSRQQEKNLSSALKYGIDPNRAYPDLDTLLLKEQGKLDAIIILTPQDQHKNQIMTCLDHETPIICEKALVPSSSDAAKIRNRLETKQGFLAVTYNYTGYPMIRELKHMVASGMLGKVQQIQMEMPQEGFARVGSDGKAIVPQEWRLHDSFVPTISLDLGVHLHMMVRFLVGACPEEVVAVSSSRGNFSEIIDSLQCLASYSENIHCNIWYSKTAYGYRNGLRLRILGDKGAAEWIQENPEYIQYADNEGGRYSLDRTSKSIEIANHSRYQRFKAGHPAGFIEAFANYYSDVADTLHKYHSTAVNDFGQYVFGVNDAQEGLQMMEAIARSCVSKQWESV